MAFLPASTRVPPVPRSPRTHAAREVIAICTSADRLADEATGLVGVDDDRLFALLEQREEMLADLAEHLVALRLERPTADNPLLAASERTVDEADALVSAVCEALGAAQRSTVALAVRVAERTAELRAELASVGRAGQATLGYGSLDRPTRVDRVR